jgi:hypothetical protein
VYFMFVVNRSQLVMIIFSFNLGQDRRQFVKELFVQLGLCSFLIDLVGDVKLL